MDSYARKLKLVWCKGVSSTHVVVFIWIQEPRAVHLSGRSFRRKYM
jgi:hypothetical protein